VVYQQSDDIDQVVLLIEPTQIIKGIPSFWIFAIDVDPVLSQQELNHVHQIVSEMATLRQLEKWRQPFIIDEINVDTLAQNVVDLIQGRIFLR
jgi:hypothetical protein